MSHGTSRPAMSKARMLAWAEGRITTARFLPLETFTVAEWERDAIGVTRRVRMNQWASNSLIVRSSAPYEDMPGSSSAGKYASVLSVSGENELESAVRKVIASYGDLAVGGAEVFVQPMLRNAVASGAATSFDPSRGGRYRVINWADGPETDAVLSGSVGGLHHWQGVDTVSEWSDHPVVGRVLASIREIELSLRLEAFEIEFGIDAEGDLVMFQIRELSSAAMVDRGEFFEALKQTTVQVEAASTRDERILGTGILLGAMSDWNPAELIGLQPMPLARSIYQRMVTDRAWSERRAEYGYRDLRNLPLMVDLAGYAFIDVKASITSLIPAQIPLDVAVRLAEACAQRLRQNPTLHDKVEFDVCVTCMSFDASESIRSFVGHGLHDRDVAVIETSLRSLTEQICRQDLIATEMRRVSELGVLRATSANLKPLQRFVKLLSDALSWGTVPFGGLARCSFVATQVLKSAVARGVLAADDLDCFFAALSLPSKQLRHDLGRLTRDEVLARYGHLRPGTYDIRTPRYDEAPHRYFLENRVVPQQLQDPEEEMPAKALATLNQGFQALGLDLNAKSFLTFAKAAIEAREWAKFEFSHSISEALLVLTDWGRLNGFGVGELAYLTCDDIEKAAVLPADAGRAFLREQVRVRGDETVTARAINLPLLLRFPSECHAFKGLVDQPNYITRLRVVARVADIERGDDPAGAIVVVQNADPGYDWLFATGMVGMITAFGGANSHMAVRALEIGIPAAIGCGSLLYDHLAGFRIVELDAGARYVRGLA